MIEKVRLHFWRKKNVHHLIWISLTFKVLNKIEAYTSTRSIYPHNVHESHLKIIPGSGLAFFYLYLNLGKLLTLNNELIGLSKTKSKFKLVI